MRRVVRKATSVAIVVTFASMPATANAASSVDPDIAAMLNQMGQGGGGGGGGSDATWAGWVADDGSFTSVSGTWVEPKVQCAGLTHHIVGAWVGLDGASSDTVEQIGSSAHCINGVDQHYAWYELYPTKATYLPASKYPVEVGDTLTGTVKRAGGNFTFTLTNASKVHAAWKFTTTAALANAAGTSAEWAVEAPLPSVNGSPYQIPPFGKYVFTNCTATSNGQTVTAKGTSPMRVNITGSATAGNINADGKSFTVTSVK